MAMTQTNLLSWEAMEARGDLDRLQLVLDHLPAERLVHYLEVMRQHGRDDYPVRAMWNAVPAGMVLQHERTESLLRELARNPSLMEACGFDPDADWGHHETQGVDARTAKAWKKLKRWFGYGLPDPLPDGSDRRLCRRLHAVERRIAGSPAQMRVQPGLHRRVHPVRRIREGGHPAPAAANAGRRTERLFQALELGQECIGAAARSEGRIHAALLLSHCRRQPASAAIARTPDPR